MFKIILIASTLALLACDSHGITVSRGGFSGSRSFSSARSYSSVRATSTFRPTTRTFARAPLAQKSNLTSVKSPQHTASAVGPVLHTASAVPPVQKPSLFRRVFPTGGASRKKNSCKEMAEEIDDLLDELEEKCL